MLSNKTAQITTVSDTNYLVTCSTERLENRRQLVNVRNVGYCYRRQSVFVSLLVMTVNPAKTAEPFGGRLVRAQGTTNRRGLDIVATRRIRPTDLCDPTRGSLGPLSLHPKPHVDRVSRFCTTHHILHL